MTLVARAVTDDVLRHDGFFCFEMTTDFRQPAHSFRPRPLLLLTFELILIAVHEDVKLLQ